MRSESPSSRRCSHTKNERPLWFLLYPTQQHRQLTKPTADSAVKRLEIPIYIHNFLAVDRHVLIQILSDKFAVHSSKRFSFRFDCLPINLA